MLKTFLLPWIACLGSCFSLNLSLICFIALWLRLMMRGSTYHFE